MPAASSASKGPQRRSFAVGDPSAGVEPATADPLARGLPTRTEVLCEWLAGEPLVPPALGLISGICLDWAWPVPTLAAAGLLLAAGVLLVLARASDGLRHMALAAAALALGAVSHDAGLRHYPGDHIVRYCSESSSLARLTGTIAGAPLIRPTSMGRTAWFSQPERTHLLLDIDAVQGLSGWIPVSGLVAVTVSEPALHVQAGDRVEVFGSLHRPAPPANPGELDFRLIMRRGRILVAMNCDHAAAITVHSTAGGSGRWLASVRQRASAAMLDDTFHGEVPGCGLLQALVLGQRSAVDRRINDAFVATGTVHYLSVSGAHVGMLASVIWLLGLVAGLSRRTTTLLALVLITAYAVLAEPNAPIIRSAVMADAYCIAVLLGRPAKAANWLALSALLLLIYNPAQLFEAGFQLSFLTLISLIYLGPQVSPLVLNGLRRLRGVNDPLLAPEIQARFNPAWPRRAFWHIERTVAFSLGVSLSAWAASVPLCAYHFRQVSWWGWLDTLFMIPLVWATLVVGLAKTVLSALAPAVGSLLGPVLAWLTGVLIWLVQFLARLGGCWLLPSVPLWLGAAAVALYAAWMIRYPARLRVRELITATLLVATVAGWQLAPARPSRELRLNVLSVGSGLACLITLPDGKVLAYDMGARPPYDMDRRTIAPALSREHAYGLDALVISHGDLDHFSAVPDVLESRTVRCVVTSPHFDAMAGPSAQAARITAELAQRQVRRVQVIGGNRLSGTSDVRIDVLWPPPPERFRSAGTNDTSVVLRIEYRGKRILLCGDIEQAAEQALLARGDVRADVLVLPHHGSITPVTQAFVQAVNPAWCIRSNSRRDAEKRRRDGDHMGTAAGAHCRFLDTGLDGAIRVQIANDLTVRTWRGQPWE